MMIIILQPDPDSQHIINISLAPIMSHEPIIGGFINEELNTKHLLHIFKGIFKNGLCVVDT